MTLIADGADAIRNGFYEVFPNDKLVNAKHICKHIIALAVKENIFEFPEMANPVLLAPRRTAGRVAKAKQALQYQQ